MKFFIDTANLTEIKDAIDLGVLDGVTTNPSLLAKETAPWVELVREICDIVYGPVSVEVTATGYEQMIDEGMRLADIHENIVVKLPLTRDGLKACGILSDNNVSVNMTLCFSPMQALLAAKADAEYVSPFIGRLDDLSQVGMSLVRDIVRIYNNYDFSTEVIVASVRHPMHVYEAAMIGADIATIPYNVIDKLLKHPMTDIGLDKFLADWGKTGQNI